MKYTRSADILIVYIFQTTVPIQCSISESFLALSDFGRKVVIVDIDMLAGS